MSTWRNRNGSRIKTNTSSLCCMANYHTQSGLKQQPFVISQFLSRSEDQTTSSWDFCLKFHKTAIEV